MKRGYLLGILVLLVGLTACLGNSTNRTSGKNSSLIPGASSRIDDPSYEKDPSSVPCTPRTDLTSVACINNSSAVDKYTVRQGTASNNCTTVKVYQECLDNNCGEKFLSKTWKNVSTNQVQTVYERLFSCRSRVVNQYRK